MPTKPKPIIKVENLSKTFNVPLDKGDAIKHYFVNIFRRKRGYRKFAALNDVSFTVDEGDFFGIVGRNGSGKSTLLKILAEIYTPSKGRIHVGGSLMPFIELGVGFNNELTGRENVFLNGAMIGFSRHEMEGMYKEIVDFAELHDFMEEKLKNYSSGMKVRLAFSIAIRAESDVLLLDEVLAVGDAAFRDKCNNFFNAQKGKRTIVLVTHDMSAVEQFCNKALLLNDGKIVKIGESSDIAMMYSDIFAKEKADKLRKQNKSKVDYTEEEISMENINITQNGQVKENLQAREDFSVNITINPPKTYKNVVVGVNIFNSQGLWLVNANTRIIGSKIGLKKGKNIIKFDIQNVLTNGDYYINLVIKDEERDGLLLLKQSEVYKFSVSGIDKLVKNSLVHPSVKITLPN